MTARRIITCFGPAAAYALLWAAAVMLAGCQTGKRGKPSVTTPAASVLGTEGQDKPATVETGKTGFTIPKNTVVKVLPDGSAVFTAAQPVAVSSESIRASSGGMSPEVANAQVSADLERDRIKQASKDRAPLLWAAIGSALAGVLALGLLKEWPIIGRSLLAFSALAGVAWKVSEIPAWIPFVALVAAALVVIAYKRAEKDSNSPAK